MTDLPDSTRWQLWIVAFGFFMQSLDTTIVNTALPSMAQSLGESPLHMHMVIVSYVLTVAVMLPASGWLADKVGVRHSAEHGFCGKRERDVAENGRAARNYKPRDMRKMRRERKGDGEYEAGDGAPIVYARTPLFCLLRRNHVVVGDEFVKTDSVHLRQKF